MRCRSLGDCRARCGTNPRPSQLCPAGASSKRKAILRLGDALAVLILFGLPVLSALAASGGSS